MIQKKIPLKDHSNYKIGGIAEFFAEVKSVKELQDVLIDWNRIKEKDEDMFVLGSGTNVLFSDDGFKGLVIKNNISFIERENNDLIVGAGTLMSDLVEFYVTNQYSGLEWAGGLPGTVGGAIRGNAGAFGGETKDNVTQIQGLDIETQEVVIRDNYECNFTYRSSIYKTELSKLEIILSASFNYKQGNLDEIKSKTQKNIDYRIEKHPLEFPNIGSTFKNVDLNLVSEKVKLEFESSIKMDPFPVLPVAKLIIGSGLQGEKFGGAQISTKHPNFIVNIDNAKASDVKNLISLVKNKVKENYDIDLEEEIMFVGN